MKQVQFKSRAAAVSLPGSKSSRSRRPTRAGGGLAWCLSIAGLCGARGAVNPSEASSMLSSLAPPPAVPAMDKSRFTLWNPTPPENLREMNALYDSPWTVDAGHFQLETYAVIYSRNRSTSWGADTTTDLWNAGAFTLKAGVLNNLDVEVALTPYTWLRLKDNTTGGVTRQQGFGDVTLRAKLNLWGNDGGSIALALLPFVKLPTNQDNLGNRRVEGGLVVPFGVELPAGWWAVLINEFHYLHDFNGRGYHPAFANTAYFCHPIAGNLSGYFDFYSWASTERGVPWWGSIDLGLTYVCKKNVQIDCGVSVGVSDAADDVNPYLGISYRF